MMRKLLGILCLILVASGCSKDTVVNPYEGLTTIQNDNGPAEIIPTGTFAWLQQKVFTPTCANSGCHDGTFEPAFNTIASSYNTLVNQPVIANDAQNSYEYRVVPGNSSGSLLTARLTIDIPNTSGIMPAVIDPDSDWPTNGTAYIAQIESWINSGAPDMFGNLAPSAGGDFPPQVTGFMAFPQGNTTTPYERDTAAEFITPIYVDAAWVDLWFYVSDDNTSPANLTSTSVKISPTLDGFANGDEFNIGVESPITALDFANNPVNFIHKSSVDLSAAESGDVFFVRTYWSDGVQEQLTEVPTNGSISYITSLFVLQIL